MQHFGNQKNYHSLVGTKTDQRTQMHVKDDKEVNDEDGELMGLYRVELENIN